MKKFPIIIGFLLVVIICIFVALVFSSQESPRNPNTGPLSVGSTQINDKDDVYELFGEPSSVNGNLELFNSLSPTTPNEVSFDGNIPEFIRKIVTQQEGFTYQGLLTEYGEPEHVLYGEEASFGINLYVYPSKGFAFLGSKGNNFVSEIWYFRPTDLQTLMNTWARGYSTQLEPEGF